jgi:hypothetical protein
MRQSEPPIAKPEAPSAPLGGKPEEIAIATVIAKVRPVKVAVATVGAANPKHHR